MKKILINHAVALEILYKSSLLNVASNQILTLIFNLKFVFEVVYSSWINSSN